MARPGSRMAFRFIFLVEAPPAGGAAFPDGDAPADPRLLTRARRLDLGGRGTVWRAPGRTPSDTVLALGQASEIAPALRPVDCGRWTGRRLADIAAEDADGLRDWLRDPRAAPHGGETLAAATERVGAWMGEREAEGGDGIAIASPLIVAAATARALGGEADLALRLDLPPLSCVALGFNRGWRLHHFGPATGLLRRKAAT